MSLSRCALRLLLAAALLGAAVTPLLAQDAQLSGRITDPSGAIIPGTTINLTSVNTGAQRNTTSNDEGLYNVPQLQPGTYRLTAKKQGFKQVSRDNILLQVGDRVTFNVPMEIGAATETVTITAEVPLLRTEDAEQGVVIDSRRIMELPQYSRDPLAFAQLAPNVNGSSNEDGYGSSFRINGGRTNQAEYFQDGMPITTGFEHVIPPSTPSKEAVSEFKVVTSGVSAEYGRLSGGTVMLVTRSGSNEYHGSAYEFLKNQKLNANTWNSNRLGRAIGVFHDNVYGFTFGGPVYIPKVYKGRDRTFFFLNYEGTRHVAGSNASTASVPTDLEKAGDFTQSLYHGGQHVQIFDPTTGVLVNGVVTRSQFPGNIIPKNRFNPLSVIYESYFPEPNTAPQVNTNNVNNYIYQTTSPSQSGKWTGRVDQNWSPTNSTHFTITQYGYLAKNKGQYSSLQPLSTSNSNSYTASVEHDWVVSPSTVITFRGGVTRPTSFSGSTVSVDDSSWGLPQNVINLMGGTNNQRTPLLTNMSGIAALGGGTPDFVWEASYNGSISLQKIKGRHTIKVGWEHRRYYSNEMTGGSFEQSSDAQVTSQTMSSNGTNGYVQASYLLGYTFWGDGAQLAGPASLETYWGAYAQDDFKATKKLTLNYGTRWEMEPPRTERFNRESFWDPNYTWNIQPDPSWSWSQVTAAIGNPNLPQPVWMTQGIHGRVAMMGSKDYPMRSLDVLHRAHIGPRVGMAYQVMPKTVIRASYGLIWMTTTGNYFLGAARWNVGYGDSARLSQGGTPDGGLTYPATFNNPMPGNSGYVPLSLDSTVINKAVMGNWWLSESPQFTGGYEHNIQLSIQREFGSAQNSWVVEAAYNGSLGRNLPVWLGKGYNILPDAYHKIGNLGSSLLQNVPNPFYYQIPAGTSRSGKTIPLGQLYETIPLWSQVTTQGDPDGTSNYTSGYIKIEHRFGHGFSVLANYTLAKLMQDCGGIDNSAPGPAIVQAGISRKDIYSVSQSDFRHKVVLNYSYELPFGRGKKFLNSPSDIGAKILDKVVGGWVAAGTTTMHSGTPITITGASAMWWNAGQATNSGNSERPLFVYPRINDVNNVSGHNSLLGSSGFVPYMNKSSFRLAQAFPNLLEIGDVGPVQPELMGPSFSQWDFALMKNFRFAKESQYLQVRFEAQNVLNHMNTGNPTGDITSTNFGIVTGQSGSPRQAMVAMKLYF